jgi:fibronectin-binding autotransporter adhesin
MLRSKPSGTGFAFVPSGLTRLCCALILLISVCGAEAASWTWDGTGGNVNWNTGANWTAGTIPASNSATDLIFTGTNNTGTALVPLNQNIASPIQLNSLAFALSSGSFFLGGNALSFTGPKSSITQGSDSAQSIANNISPTTNTIKILTLDGDGAGVVTLSGVISDSNGHRDYSVVKTGNSVFSLTGVNTYSGGTTINGGTLIVNSSASLGDIAGSLTVNAGTLEVTTGFTSARATTLNNATSTFEVDPAQTFTITGAIGGTGALNKTGTGTMVLGGINTYSGGTVVSAGTLRTSASERIANTSNLTVSGGTFDVQTFTETLANITLSSGSITGTGAGRVTGTSFAVQSGSASAILAGTGATMTKTTAGTVTLTGANTFTGATTISGGTLTAAASSGSALGATSSVTVNSGGTLMLGANNQINNTAPITLAGGTFSKGNFSEGTAASPGTGALTLTASGSQVDFGSGTVGVLNFAGFTPGSFTLTVSNWTGTLGTVGNGSTDRLIFASSQSANLGNFAFDGYGPGAMEFNLGNGYYEITPVSPVPEPSTYITALFALATIGFQQARRFRRASKSA